MTPASLVLDLVERVWNGGDLAALHDYYADPYEHDGGIGTVAELLEWHRDQSATWAATSYSVLDCVASGEAVALRWRATSTRVGPEQPGTSTDRRVEWVGAHFFRVEHDRIVTMHSFARSGQGIPRGVRVTHPELP